MLPDGEGADSAHAGEKGRYCVEPALERVGESCPRAGGLSSQWQSCYPHAQIQVQWSKMGVRRIFEGVVDRQRVLAANSHCLLGHREKVPAVGFGEGERRHRWTFREERFRSDCCMGALAPESVRRQGGRGEPP